MFAHTTIYRLNRLNGDPRATFTDTVRKQIIEKYEMIQNGDWPDGARIYMSGVTKEVKMWVPGDEYLIGHWGYIDPVIIKSWMKFLQN